MKATIRQAEKNDRNLSIRMTGYGHWKVSIDYKGLRISTTTTNSQAIDDFKSDFLDKENGKNRRLNGYLTLCEEIIRDNF